ncbi:unnamed protein product [Agarophyton chilense]
MISVRKISGINNNTSYFHKAKARFRENRTFAVQPRIDRLRAVWQNESSETAPFSGRRHRNELRHNDYRDSLYRTNTAFPLNVHFSVLNPYSTSCVKKHACSTVSKGSTFAPHDRARGCSQCYRGIWRGNCSWWNRRIPS